MVAIHCPWGEWLVDDGNTPPGTKLSRKTLQRRHILFGTLPPGSSAINGVSRLHKKPPSESRRTATSRIKSTQPTRQCWRSVASRPSWPAVTSRF
ncbi:hypothetical protein CI102_5658 [Trichoderma harzianum]|nr:hypothetical protein CI102_5658 [Trichoderma harzianum]